MLDADLDTHDVLTLSPDFTTLQLLIELSYGGIYTKRTWDGPTLSNETLLQLVGVANMFEFNDCIKACCEQMGRGLNADLALSVVACLSHLEPAREPISKLVDAAIAAIGPLEGLWGQGSFCKGPIEAVKCASITKIKVSLTELQRKWKCLFSVGITQPTLS